MTGHEICLTEALTKTVLHVQIDSTVYMKGTGGIRIIFTDNTYLEGEAAGKPVRFIVKGDG